MPEELQKEVEQMQKGLGEGEKQKQEKNEGKTARITRKIVLWVVMLGFILLVVMIVMRKCSGEI